MHGSGKKLAVKRDLTPEERAAIDGALAGYLRDLEREFQDGVRADFENWLRDNERRLARIIADWLPAELGESKDVLLTGLIPETLAALDSALEVTRPKDFGGGDEEADAPPEDAPAGAAPNDDPEESEAPEVPPEPEDSIPADDPRQEKLLNRLLYKGVLPRYAFPTDVAALYIIDTADSSSYRPAFQFAPTQALPVALSQYAPGKEVWIAGRKFVSGAIYSPIRDERWLAWQNRRIYYECGVCQYATTKPRSEGVAFETADCPGCGTPNALGPSRRWLRPPGFAHPIDVEEATSPEEIPASSYATRAKLLAPTPEHESAWMRMNERVRVHHRKDHLLVTIRGPKLKGYNYCLRCGRIEPATTVNSIVTAPHRKPYPDPRDSMCPGGRAVQGIVLGTDFITDVLLVSLRVDPPLSLRPDLFATEVALRTVSDALARAAATVLQLEPTELAAEFRPALI